MFLVLELTVFPRIQTDYMSDREGDRERKGGRQMKGGRGLSHVYTSFFTFVFIVCANFCQTHTVGPQQQKKGQHAD